MSSLGLVQGLVESQMAGVSKSRLPRRGDPDLGGLATFTLDGEGRVTAWPLTATHLFGHPAHAMTGHDVCDVLMSGPGQRELVSRALAEVAAGRVWTATVAGGNLGEGRVAMRWESQAVPGGGVVVVAQRASAQPTPGWLSEAAARIGSTLDLSRTAREVVDAAVPLFADAAVIYVAERLLVTDEFTSPRVGRGTAMRLLAGRAAGQDAAGQDPGSQDAGSRDAGSRDEHAAAPTAMTQDAAALDFDSYTSLPAGEVIVFGAGSPGAQAMEAKEPVPFGKLDAETAEWLGRRPGGEEVATRFTSFLAVPLIARGAVLGCVTFGRAPSSLAFSPGDIAQAGELASRAAVCIDNARLYHRERRTALALQRGLLPSRPQIPAALEVAQRYLPVGASVVGGDWHDIVTLPGGQAVLIVGDAMGHGPEAAAVMVQLRTAAHTLADLGLPPVEVLRRLDVMAAGMAAAPFATCIYTVIDPAASSCAAAQAGHLPPVLVLPGGDTQLLDLPSGLPLGVGGGTYTASQIGLPLGATLALYTDGLVESRARPIDAGLAALRAALGSALAEPGAPLGEACERVTEALRQQGEDDITLVLARIRR